MISSHRLHAIDEFRLIRPLGEPGAETFLAHDQLLDRAVVVRFLSKETLAQGRALARISHPHLARLHRVREGARPYLVMEWVRGAALEAPLPAGELMRLGRALASALATLHHAGLVHGDVRAARVIATEGGPLLVGLDRARAATDAGRHEDTAALVALLGRLGLEVADVGSTDELMRELDLRLRPGRDTADLENPYRGLRAYGADDHEVFFGRDDEVEKLLARLKTEPRVVVTGRSGAGKSSLVRASLAPAIAGGALGERARWDVVVLAPGHAPTVREDRGLCLIVDPLDEVLLHHAPAERDAFLAMLAGHGNLTPGVRVVLTLRSELLGALSELGVAGRDLVRTATPCGAMTAEGLREAIVGPAHARGFDFESSATVDALVAGTLGREAALPILSFTLAELWQARDPVRRVIPEAALARLGGLGSALARHGDRVLSGMSPRERRAARRVLLALATDGGRPRDELLTGADPAAGPALDALVTGRLVVASERHELAHEAMVSAWPRLRGWLDEASGAQAAAARVDAAARDWDRLGRPDEALLSPRQLAELPPGASGEFVARSQAAARRARRRRGALRLGIPAALVVFAAAAWGVVSFGERREARDYVDARLADATTVLEVADRLEASALAMRRDAFARYDANQLDAGEIRWREARATGERELERLGAASQLIELARARDPSSERARALAADLFLRWLLLARREAHDPVLEDELRSRLARVDDGTHAARLAAPAHLTVTTSPPGARVVLRAVTRGARYSEDEGRELSAAARTSLPPGPYVLEAALPGRYPTRDSVLLPPGDEAQLELVLPPAVVVPDGMLYVPAGRVRFGYEGNEAVRAALHTSPAHDVAVPAFLIAADEVTWGDFMEYVDTLAPAVRDEWGARARGIEAQACLPARPRLRCRSWRRLPIEAVTWDQAHDYVGWLAARIPGARLCTEREWERAARGADGRLYPGGDAPPAGDLNMSEAWHGDDAQLGLDEVGSYPLDRSPFGVLDLGGNVAEWVGDTIDGARPDDHVGRGGWWHAEELGFPTPVRLLHAAVTGPLLGVRVCASVP